MSQGPRPACLATTDRLVVVASVVESRASLLAGPSTAECTGGRGSHPQGRSAAEEPRSGLTAVADPCVINASEASLPWRRLAVADVSAQTPSGPNLDKRWGDPPAQAALCVLHARGSRGRRTTPKRYGGRAVRPSRDAPARRTTSTPLPRRSWDVTALRGGRVVVPPFRRAGGMPAARTTSAGCTRPAGAYGGIASKLSVGTVGQPGRGTNWHRTTSTVLVELPRRRWIPGLAAMGVPRRPAGREPTVRTALSVGRMGTFRKLTQVGVQLVAGQRNGGGTRNGRA